MYRYELEALNANTSAGAVQIYSTCHFHIDLFLGDYPEG